MLGQQSVLGKSGLWTLCLSLIILLLLHTAGAFAPSGRWLYDHASSLAYDLHWSKQATAKGVYEKRPVMIAVDEASLRSLGRWPWARRVHAELLNTIARSPAAPSVLAWDVVFAEPQIAGVQRDQDGRISHDDALFARAINDSGFPIILATQFEETGTQAQQRRLIVPRAPLNTSIARIAHIHIDTDVDGSVRRFWLEATHLPGITLPYLGRALWQPNLALPITQLSVPAVASVQSAQDSAFIQNSGNKFAGTPSNGVLLYPMPSDWVRQIPYQDVLSGVAVAKHWAGVPVLVAATAKGLGDQYVTHLYQPSNVVAGGELVLGAMHTEQLHAAGLPQLSMAHWVWEALALLGFMGGVLYGLRRCERISTQLGVLMLTLIAVVTFCVGLLAYVGVWFNAALLGVGVAVVWMMWMSFALQRFVQHIQLRLKQLGHFPTPFKSNENLIHTQNQIFPQSHARLLAKNTSKGNIGNTDVIAKQLSAVVALEQRQQDEFFRLSQVLDLLPDAAIVLNAQTRSTRPLNVQLHNLAARQLCLRFPAMQSAVNANSVSLNALLADFVPDLNAEQHACLDALKIQTVFQWQDLLIHHGELAFAQGIESNSGGGERFLIKVAQLLEAPTQSDVMPSELLLENSLIVSIIDLSVGLKLAQSRERTLNFLSHDIRSPQANIVALLELEKATHPELASLFSKVQFQAQRTLHLAEGFVQWSQASHRPAYQFIEYNLNELMIDALDEQWASAKHKGIHLTGFSSDKALWVMLDRSLMWRALVNLISNALNACSAGQEVRLSTRQSEQYAVITVQDNGPGIPIEFQTHLFEPFVQGIGLKRTGAGLGLAFVKTVIDQHQGQLKLHSPVSSSPQPHGTRFELWLPLAPEIISHEEDGES